MRHSILSKWLAIVVLLVGSMSVNAEQAPVAKPKPDIELGAPFADNAILQRQMPVPVWGWSKPGVKVMVEFAGQTKTATAGEGYAIYVNGKLLAQSNAGVGVHPAGAVEYAGVRQDRARG